MNEKQLITEIGQQAGLSAAKVKDVLGYLASEVQSALIRGDDVTIPGLVKLSVVQKEAGMGRNPRTGEAIEIAARRAPKATFLKALKDAVKV